jgi:hypothetical protein
MAHGCYWKKCTFCDISLDYIGHYEPHSASLIVDRMEQLIQKTTESGFHFVDEAAPPALMRDIALEIIKRELTVTWWANIRFEKKFTADLCRLLSLSGCIAISGGLEVASNRLLKLINKGVTVEQVARVTKHFMDANIMVHAYLMYGYPSQTIQETIDSLEMVRQMFENEIIQSGFWHQFALTTHSPIGQKPEKYGIKPHLKEITFANNDIEFTDSTGINHEKFSFGLKKSLYNYMHGICFEYPLKKWFDFENPKTRIAPDFIHNIIETTDFHEIKPRTKLIWTSPIPEILFTQNKEINYLVFYNNTTTHQMELNAVLSIWIKGFLQKISIHEGSPMSYSDSKTTFEQEFDDFTIFWYGEIMENLKEIGLLLI